MPEKVSVFKNAENEEAYMAAYDEALKLWPIPHESVFVSTEIGETHVLVSGAVNEKAVVLLPGALASATMWYPNVGQLGKHFRIYAIDTVGDFGKSRISSLPKSREDLANWLCAVIEGLAIEKPHIVGLSYGGFLAANIGCYYPEHIDKIVMMAPAAVIEKLRLKFFVKAMSTFFWPSESRVDAFWKWMIAEGNDVDNACTAQFKLAVAGGRRVKISVVPSVFSDDELKSLMNPVLLMVGDQEVMYDGLSVLEKAKKLIPNIQTNLVTECGHAVSGEQAEFVNQRVLEFFGILSEKGYV